MLTKVQLLNWYTYWICAAVQNREAARRYAAIGDVGWAKLAREMMHDAARNAMSYRKSIE